MLRAGPPRLPDFQCSRHLRCGCLCTGLTSRGITQLYFAEEMLERALYALEMAWHPSFSPAAANMHVPYDEANAPLFICLFRHGGRSYVRVVGHTVELLVLLLVCRRQVRQRVRWASLMPAQLCCAS